MLAEFFHYQGFECGFDFCQVFSFGQKLKNDVNVALFCFLPTSIRAEQTYFGNPVLA